jgi:hypothetical protein
MTATLLISLTQGVYALAVVIGQGYANSFTFQFLLLPSWAFFILVAL